MGAFNLIVDPFDLYRIVDRAGLNHNKPEKYVRVRLLKLFELERVKPGVVALGTSRTHLGIRMTHPGWNPAFAPGYNLAFDSATTHEIYAYLRDAQAVRPLRQVVLGLDTWQLTNDPSGVIPGFEDAFLDRPDSAWRNVASHIARLGAAFSLDTLLASFHTLGRQFPSEPDSFAPDGQRLGEVLFRSGGKKNPRGDPGAEFALVDRREIMSALKIQPAAQVRAGGGARPDLSSMAYVREIVAFCRANAIELFIFITPMHADQMEIRTLLGEWTKIEASKRMLVQILAEDSAAHPGAKPIPLWDFTGYNSVTTEPVPPPGSQRQMAYYWDSSHFKEAVGDWILDRLFGIPADVPADFGIALTPESIDGALAQIRADRAIYLREHKGDAVRIRALAEEIYRSHPRTPRREASTPN